MKTIQFQIEGMSCGGCSGSVQSKFLATEGIVKAEVSHETKIAELEYDETILSEENIFQMVNNMNYIPSKI